MDRSVLHNSFIHSLITLLSGTVIAQAIPILVSPLIARLYAPGDLGTLALFSALTAVLCVLATCRLELVIPLVRTENEALRLLAGIGLLALSVCTLLYVLLLLFCGPIAAALHNPGLATWLWYLPLSVLAVSLYQALTYWFNRRRRYLEIAGSRVAQSAAAAAVQLVLGQLRAGAPGLLAGALLGQFIALGRLAQLALRAGRHHLRPGFLLRCWAVLRRHRRFPLFMVPGQMANVASLQVAVVLLSLCYGHAVAGYYALAERVIIAPSAIVGTAVGDAFRQHAAEQYRAHGNCRALYLRTSLMLAGFAALAFVVLAVGARWLFVLVFGAEWRAAGEIASVMAALMFFQILSSPLSQTVFLAKMQHLDMLWQFGRLVAAAVGLLLGYWIWRDYMMSIALYVGATCVMYCLHSMMQYRAACGVADAGAPA